MSAKKIVITGGAGFVGTNLIKYFLEKTKLNIISIDNYSSSSKRNHIKSSRVRYIKAHTKNISTVLNPKKIHSIFHFGEFARIYQSFLQMDKCIDSNSIGTNAVINFCLKNKIKLIYSATSASLGNKGKDKNLDTILPFKFSSFLASKTILSPKLVVIPEFIPLNSLNPFFLISCSAFVFL